MKNKDTFSIDGNIVGNGRCFIIAEIAQAHDGSLGTAHAYIDAVAQAGADAIKFQTHIAAEESTPDEPFRIQFSKQDANRYEYWKRMEFTKKQWTELHAHCKEVGITFLSSPFSEAAVDMLEDIGMPAWKIASGEVSNIPMLTRIAETNKPVLLSTGMSDITEIQNTLAFLKEFGISVLVFQTTTAYPCPPEQIGINNISILRELLEVPVGLSDHSGTIFSPLAASAIHIDMLEIHVTFSKQMFGPDVPASITIDELSEVVKGIRYIEQMINNPVDKNQMAEQLKPLRSLFAKSIVANKDLNTGHKLSQEDLAFKKPGTGLPPNEAPNILGKQLNKSIKADKPILLEDLVQ
ncbi:MAG: N-acetylneuraminate synthase [Legionellales bacterium]|nr:N-acetylneuraminate synthase [Legionellales bacterium]|tara:strand:- start:2981 stop:4033 length:1053 start_codon:yes stop_codon:yes gene_type:complete